MLNRATTPSDWGFAISRYKLASLTKQTDLAHMPVLDLGVGTQKLGHFLVQPQPNKVPNPLYLQ